MTALPASPHIWQHQRSSIGLAPHAQPLVTIQTKETAMTTLELKLELPDLLAQEAQAAGLLTPQALADMVQDVLRRRAARRLLDGAERATQSGSQPLSMQDIQAEVRAVRRTRLHQQHPSGTTE